MIIPIPIPIGVRHHVVVRGATWKVVPCEHCQQRFAFLIEMEGQGSDGDFLFLNSSESMQRARAQAQQNLADKIRNSVVAIPCPQCGFYQADMVRQLKHAAWTNPMQIIGAIVIVLSFAPLAFEIDDNWILTAVTATAGAVLLAKGYVISARYDPNAGDPAPRIEFARQHSVWGEQLAQLLKEIASQTE